MAPGAEGRVLVVTEVADDNYVYKGSPASFTGSATQLQLPLGVITREIALVVFGRAFKEGSDRANEIKTPGIYRLIVKPRTTSFDYKYNQLRNLGFAITPQTRIFLEVMILDPNGKEVLKKTYDSGLVNGTTYLMSGSPGEMVNRTAHEVLYQLMEQAASDALALLNPSS
jgi:hypothetical protein